jgi:uncharacterized protein
MRYNVAQLLKEAIGSHRNIDIEEDICDADHPVEQVRGTVDMVRTHQGIWIQAQLDVRVPQDCARCLESFSRTLSIELDEEFFPEIDVKTGARVLLPDDWEALYISPDHNLDLAEATRQATLATLPLKPLCRPDCVGICDRCGCDRNKGSCDCYNREIDPRWAALRSLMDDQQT